MSGDEDINQTSEKGRGTTRPGQEGLQCSHLAGGEDGALFEIREMRRHDISPHLPFRLFLRRRNGYKFKKGFRTHEEAMWFVEPYLRLCCEACKANGMAQKVLDVGGIHDGWSNFPHASKRLPFASGQRPPAHRGHCPICKTVHEVYYNGHVKSVRRKDLDAPTGSESE